MKRPHRWTGKQATAYRKPILATHPLIILIHKEIDRREIFYEDIVKGSGVSRRAISNWRRNGKGATVTNFEAVANYLGYDLVLVKRNAKAQLD